MDFLRLADEIISGRRLGRADDTDSFITADLDELLKGADRIRKALCGDHIDLCSIINGRSGRCSENCKFCAQSAHNCTGIDEYGFLDEETIVDECRHNAEKGVHRFSIVTAGRTLSGADFDRAVSAYSRMNSSFDIELCGSHGLLTDEQFRRLKEAGVKRYHCNIETSRRNFPNICTTHSFDEKIDCIKRAQAAGLQVCSGGIIGMGETWEDRVDMALTLAELGVDSVPINSLIPIKGTPLEELTPISEEDILRTVAIVRYILPTADIRLAAGRNLMEGCGRKAFLSGANSTITGDMLTTSGNGIADDTAMFRGMGFDIGRRQK